MDDVPGLDRSCIQGLTCRIVGSVVNFYDELESTNILAREMAEGNCRDGTVIVANRQTGGKGRMRRRWESPPGGLYLSVVLRPMIPAEQASIIPLIAGLAVSKAISTTALLETSLKWPNDILIDERKVSGILVESSVKGEIMEFAVIGIGINANVDTSRFPDDFSKSSISLMEKSGEAVDREELLRNILYFLDMIYARFMDGGGLQLLDEWAERSSTVGSEVIINLSGGHIVGKAVGLDDTGALLLSREGEIIRITEGDCVHLRDE
ncbi:MAG: biotin--[acetyl-CoA-carboxylase] ligase [Thermoplasmatota archaeon]